MEHTYILVTGASSGIGKDIAVQLSATNNIILNGRDNERLEKTYNACNKKNHHLIWQFDLFNIDAVEESLSKFLMENGCFVSSFIHAAGYLKTIPLKVLSVENFQSSFNINVIAAAMTVKVLTKKINQTSLKSIVFISSNISNFGAKAFSAYTASKAALDGLMRCFAVELAPTVRVNSILPGGVRTAMTEHIYQDEELTNRMASTYPLGLGTTNDIVSVTKFLISKEAQWITGQQITVDGGRTINITG